MPPASPGQKIGLAPALLVFTVLLSRVLGFLRDAVIAALFGANGATDAFYAAFTIPDWLNYIVAVGTGARERCTRRLAPSFLKKMRGDDVQLAMSLTRILLPAQLFFYLGGI